MQEYLLYKVKEIDDWRTAKEEPLSLSQISYLSG